MNASRGRLWHSQDTVYDRQGLQGDTMSCRVTSAAAATAASAVGAALVGVAVATSAIVVCRRQGNMSP